MRLFFYVKFELFQNHVSLVKCFWNVLRACICGKAKTKEAVLVPSASVIIPKAAEVCLSLPFWPNLFHFFFFFSGIQSGSLSPLKNVPQLLGVLMIVPDSSVNYFPSKTKNETLQPVFQIKYLQLLADQNTAVLKKTMKCIFRQGIQFPLSSTFGLNYFITLCTP